MGQRRLAIITGQDDVPEHKYTRSISQLKAYSRCSEAFYLERFKRTELPVRPAPWTTLGVAFHDTVMAWEKSDRSIDALEYFANQYDNITAEQWVLQPDAEMWFLPPGTKYVKAAIKNYRDRGLTQVPTYIKRCEQASWEISHIEKEFEIDLDGITVKGGVDRILFFPSEEEYVIEDIKTGNLKGENDVRQLAFYAFVARELWEIPVREGRYWFTKMDRGSDFVDLTRFGREFWEREFKRLNEGINREIFLASPGDQCTICSVSPWCSVMGGEVLP